MTPRGRNTDGPHAVGTVDVVVTNAGRQSGRLDAGYRQGYPRRSSPARWRSLCRTVPHFIWRGRIR